MNRTTKIVAIAMALLLAGSAVASAAAGDLGARASGQAEAEANANAGFGLDALLELLGFASTQADAAADGAGDADVNESLFSDVSVRAGAEADVEQRVRAETPRAPDFPPKVDLYSEADEVFRMTALADQTVVLTYDAGVAGQLVSASEATLEGPGYSGSLNLLGTANAAGEANGHLEVSTHEIVVFMQEGETLVMKTEGQYDMAYKLAADAYGEVQDEAHVTVDETVRAYMGLQAEAETQTQSQQEWAVEQAEFHKEFVLGVVGQAQGHAEGTAASATDAAGSASGSASATASATANAAASAASGAHPPVCDI